MSKWLLAAVALAYVWTAIEFARDNKPGLALAFMCYALSNVGFIIAATEK